MTKQENEERLARLKNIVLSMPEKPGSYQYYDENHTIIYVGKAKNRGRRSLCCSVVNTKAIFAPSDVYMNIWRSRYCFCFWKSEFAYFSDSNLSYNAWYNSHICF